MANIEHLCDDCVDGDENSGVPRVRPPGDGERPIPASRALLLGGVPTDL